MKTNYQPRLQYEISSALGAVIGGGTSLLGDVFNLFGQSKANREQEAYNMNIMNTQRQWALQDIANQNAYNSPVQQMTRLKEAGLNPNLVYGEGITASGQSDQPRSVPAPSFSPGNVLGGFSNLGAQATSALETGFDLPNRTQSLNNMKAEELNKKADTIIKKLTGNVLATEPGATTDTSTLTDNQTDIRSLKTEILSSQQNKAANDAAISGVESFIAQNTQSSKISQAVQAGYQAVIKTMADGQAKDNLVQTYQNLVKTGELLKLDIQSQSWDFNANSPVWQQVVYKILHALLSHVSK